MDTPTADTESAKKPAPQILKAFALFSISYAALITFALILIGTAAAIINVAIAVLHR